MRDWPGLEKFTFPVLMIESCAVVALATAWRGCWSPPWQLIQRALVIGCIDCEKAVTELRPGEVVPVPLPPLPVPVLPVPVSEKVPDVDWSENFIFDLFFPCCGTHCV